MSISHFKYLINVLVAPPINPRNSTSRARPSERGEERRSGHETKYNLPHTNPRGQVGGGGSGNDAMAPYDDKVVPLLEAALVLYL